MANIMADLLTAREVQDILKVDRTTIYRMIKDGRLTGIKVGGRWRFSYENVRAILNGEHVAEPSNNNNSKPAKLLPQPCAQTVQDVMAEIAQIGAVTTDFDGEPVMSISNTNEFCQLILDSDRGNQACKDCWRKIAHSAWSSDSFIDCHAGLQYTCHPIKVQGENTLVLIAGQFYYRKPDKVEETERIARLAQDLGINLEALSQAAEHITVLDDHKRKEISCWMAKVASSFEHMAQERAEFVDRLQRIAAISAVNP